MAKISAIQKNLKRMKLVKKYSKKRAELKKIIKNKKLELSERFAAQLKLNKLPKNSSKIRVRNRCEVSGRPHGVYRKLKISRIALRDMASSGKIQVLQNQVGRRIMTLTDPIGDMFSRIRNGQMRSLNSINIPSSNFRRNILAILKNEGYIKDFFIEKTINNKIVLKINLKYYEGNP